MANFPTSGVISFSDMASAISDSAPYSLGDWYRGADYVPDISSNAGVPVSGAISMNDFYGGGTTYPGGSASYSSLYNFTRTLAACDTVTTVTSGGSTTINSNTIGNHSYTIKNGQTISSWNRSDWYSSTEDTEGSIIAIKGNLTINSGITFRPDHRKLWTVLYVKGDLILNGTLSASQRGANHSATTKANIRLATGTYGGVSNPQIPADGGVGGASANQTVNPGAAGTAGGTGGGAAGYGGGTGGTSGAGAAGTSFSGGAAGAGHDNCTAGSGGANGGAGGNACGERSGGGAGNPGGSPGWIEGNSGSSGTGGVLFIVVTGTFSGSGNIVAAGANGGNWGGGPRDGGGSGGGSITVFYGTNSFSGSVTANGGGGGGGSANNGGAGTARLLSL